ncbi:MAG: hypothetical protein ACYCS8_10335 [Acidithiobacillus sp.]
MSEIIQSSIDAPLVATRALWNWDLSTPGNPTVTSYSNGLPTKTGLMPADLQSFVGVPIQLYGNPSTPIPSDTLLQWIRWAEDWVEQETNLLLTPTWVASPPTRQPAATIATGLIVSGAGNVQKLGIDYDLEDAAYDFFFTRAQDEGWMVQSLRYRPLLVDEFYTGGYTAVKNIAYIYPLLDDFFRVPPTWYVTDHDFGLIRLVPAANVQMLPLFAMQLAFMGFAQSIPGGLWFQYTAGLKPSDYVSRFSFIKQLVLAQAAIQALSTIQGTINFGAKEYNMSVDGLQYGTKYNDAGPFNGLINRFMKMREDLLTVTMNKVAGPMLITL